MDKIKNTVLRHKKKSIFFAFLIIGMIAFKFRPAHPLTKVHIWFEKVWVDEQSGHLRLRFQTNKDILKIAKLFDTSIMYLIGVDLSEKSPYSEKVAKQLFLNDSIDIKGRFFMDNKHIPWFLDNAKELGQKIGDSYYYEMEMDIEKGNSGHWSEYIKEWKNIVTLNPHIKYQLVHTTYFNPKQILYKGSRSPLFEIPKEAILNLEEK